MPLQIITRRYFEFIFEAFDKISRAAEAGSKGGLRYILFTGHKQFSGSYKSFFLYDLISDLVGQQGFIGSCRVLIHRPFYCIYDQYKWCPKFMEYIGKKYGLSGIKLPEQFKAGNSIELKPGFSTSIPFEAIIDPNTCLG